MKNVYITIYTKEKGKLELTKEEWSNFDKGLVTYHRLDGPAVIYSNGDQEYWVNDQLHNLNGPAIEKSNGYKAYYIDDTYYTKQEYDQKTDKKNKMLSIRKIEDLWEQYVEAAEHSINEDLTIYYDQSEPFKKITLEKDSQYISLSIEEARGLIVNLISLLDE